MQYKIRSFKFKSGYKKFFLALQKRFNLNIITNENIESITINRYQTAINLYNDTVVDTSINRETITINVVQTVLYLLFQESPSNYDIMKIEEGKEYPENNITILRNRVRTHFKELGVKSLIIDQSQIIPLNNDTIATLKTQANLEENKNYYLSFITADYKIIRVNKITSISNTSRLSKWFKLLKIIRTLKYGKISNHINYENKIEQIIKDKWDKMIDEHGIDPTEDEIKEFIRVGDEYNTLSPDIVIIFHEQIAVNPELRYLRNGKMNCACKAIYDELTELKESKDSNWKISNVKKINEMYLKDGIDDTGIQELADKTYYHIVIYDKTYNLWRNFEPKVKAQDKIILVAQNGHISLAPVNIEFGENNEFVDDIEWFDTVKELAQCARDYEDKDPLSGQAVMSKESIVGFITPEIIYKLKFNEYEEYPQCFTSGGIGKSKFIKDHPEFKYGVNENNPFYQLLNDADVSGFYLRLKESNDTNFKYDQNSAYKSFYKSGIFSGFPNIEAVFTVNKLMSEFITNDPENKANYGLLYIDYETLTTAHIENKKPVYYECSGWMPIEIVKHNYINYGINPIVRTYAYASTVWNTNSFNEMTNEQFRNFLGKTTSKYSTGQWKTNNELEYMRARYILQDRILKMDKDPEADIWTINYKLLNKPWNMPIISVYVKAHQKFNLFNQINSIHRYNDIDISIISITVDCIEVDKQCDNLFIIGKSEGQWKTQRPRFQALIEKFISERDLKDNYFILNPLELNEFKYENLINSRYIHYSGAGGNGKTQHIINLSKSYLGMLFTAPTHEAVNNLKIRAKQLETIIKADTYHRVFGIGCYDNYSRENFTHIVIDECSMVSANHLKLMFDTINDSNSIYRGMILAGDFYQLPCVNDLPMFNVETNIKSAEYENFQIEELTINYRQKEDPEFFKLCNQLRNPLTKKDALEIINKLNTRVKKISFEDYKTIEDFYICGINKQVDYVNNKHKIIVGSKIILNMNIDILSKGSICEIVEMNDKILKVKYNNEIYEISAKKKSAYNLAYALTVHKSQGKTIKKNLIINPSRLFEKHHLYVALTRATKFDSIILTEPITMETMINTAYVK